jgi:cyclic beta-1,2-glucan synthetase
VLLPASEAVVALVNRLVSESVPAARLPRLALAGGHPGRAPRAGGHARPC